MYVSPSAVPEVSLHPVSGRLQPYKRRDLLRSHSRRVSSASKAGVLTPDQAGIAQAVISRQFKQREEKAKKLAYDLGQEDGGGQDGATATPLATSQSVPTISKAPAPGTSIGLFHHTGSTEAEREMNELWLQKRREEITRQRNDAEVRRAVREWQIARNRADEEITRRIQSRRRPFSASTGPVLVQSTIRDTFTPAPGEELRPKEPARRRGDDGDDDDADSLDGAPDLRKVPYGKGRPQSAGTLQAPGIRRRLAVPVAVPRIGGMVRGQGRNRPQSAALVGRSRLQAGTGTGGGAIPTAASDTAVARGLSRVEQSAALFRNIAWGDGPTDSAAAAVSSASQSRAGASAEAGPPGKAAPRPVSRSAVSGKRGSVARRRSEPIPRAVEKPPSPVPVPPSARRAQQLSEVDRIRAAFAKHNIPVAADVLERALVLTDDKPPEVVKSQIALPGAGLMENPLLELKLANEAKLKPGKKKKKKKKAKAKGKAKSTAK